MSLDELPSEILNQIISHVHSTRCLLHFSLTCKRIYEVVQKYGFNTFVTTNFAFASFPQYETKNASDRNLNPKFWKDGAHGLTTLSRNWERRAFLARDIQYRVSDRPPAPYAGRGQGWRPAIDSYQTWTGGSWDSRKDVFVWAAGPSLGMRCKRLAGTRYDHRPGARTFLPSVDAPS